MQFDSRLPHHIAGAVEVKLRLVEHVFADFADIADQVGHKAIARIETAMRRDRVQLRQLIAMRLR